MTKNLSLGSLCPRQDTNRQPPECKPGAVTPTCPVTKLLIAVMDNCKLVNAKAPENMSITAKFM
jgi:hypothetical protein